MDAFTEQLITKKKGGKELALIAVSGLLAALALGLAVYAFLIYPLFSVLILLGGGYGIFQLLIHQNIEFEYTVTNGDIDIDRIVGRRSRKRLVAVPGRKIERLEPYRPKALLSEQFDRTVAVHSGDTEANLWCFSYRSKKNGHTLVIFEPNDKVLHEMLTGLPRMLAMEVKQQNDL